MKYTILWQCTWIMKTRAIAVLATLLLSACASSQPDIKENPSLFHVLSESELSINMQAMADRITVLSLVALDNQLSLAQRRDKVVPLLNSIELIAAELDHDGAVTNYSVINRYMGAFLHDVAVARRLAYGDPPDLMPAQRLIKSCLACHAAI